MLLLSSYMYNYINVVIFVIYVYIMYNTQLFCLHILLASTIPLIPWHAFMHVPGMQLQVIKNLCHLPDSNAAHKRNIMNALKPVILANSYT